MHLYTDKKNATHSHIHTIIITLQILLIEYFGFIGTFIGIKLTIRRYKGNNKNNGETHKRADDKRIFSTRIFFSLWIP